MPRQAELIFTEGFAEFLKKEHELILKNVSERALCGRLAQSLEVAAGAQGLQGYFADVEYNRNLKEVKTIIDDQYEVIRITCDLILHSRGQIPARDNVIAVEMKKAERPDLEVTIDHKRLRALTKPSYDGVWFNDGQNLPKHVCGYELGVFILFDMEHRTYRVDFFEDGKLVKSNQAALQPA